MDLPLIIAFLALLAFALLPVLDRLVSSELGAKGISAYINRIARWMEQ